MGESWVRPATWIVTFCLAFAFVAGLSVGYHAWPPLYGYAKMFARILTLIVGLFVLWHIVALRGSPRPTRTLLLKLKSNSELAYSAAVGIGLVMVQMAALTWAKPTLSKFAGFWADPILANAEVSLFGTDPWRIAHALIGPRNSFIDISYALWFPALIGALFFTFISRNPMKSRLIVAYFLTVTLGILFQFALPSGGPIFYGRLGFENRFAELMGVIPPLAMKGSGYLWGCHLGFRQCMAGWGISAWPSIHVALAAWMVVAAATLNRRLLPLAVGWWAVIFFGSIYLGWHYAFDGIAGTFLVAMAWAIQGRATSDVTSRLEVAR